MTTRYVSIKIQREVERKYRQHCGFPGCRRPASELHHVKRFSIAKRHNVEEIVPLCKIHHELAHAGLIKNEILTVEDWKLDITEKKEQKIAEIDSLVVRQKLRSLRIGVEAGMLKGNRRRPVIPGNRQEK